MSFFTLLKILNGGDWTLLLEYSMDSAGVDNLPIRDYRRPLWLIYFLVIITGNVMILNLVIGLVLDNFK